MSRVPAKRVARGVALAGLLLAMSPAVARAQAVELDALKGAFLFNFIRFTEWPVDAHTPGTPIVTCLDAPRVADALDEIVRARSAGRPLTVQRMKATDSGAGCDVLYIGGRDPRRSLLAQTRGRPVLTVGETPQFCDAGGLVYFYVDGGHLRFAINLPAVQASRLRLSSQLLSLAKLVKTEGPSHHDSTHR